MNPTLTKSNSSYGNWCVSWKGEHTTEHKFFFKKAEALEFLQKKVYVANWLNGNS